MGAPGCAESRLSPWKTREVVDFRPAGEGAGNRTADCAAMQVLDAGLGTRASSSSLPSLAAGGIKPRPRSKCVGSNRLKTHPLPLGVCRQKSSHQEPSPTSFLPSRVVHSCPALTPRTITPFFFSFWHQRGLDVLI